MPYLQGEEMVFIQSILNDLEDSKASEFASLYSVRRKDPQTILILTLIGFLGIAGIQRFILDQIGMGLLYLLTGGLCFIGTIIDIVNYQKLTAEFNRKVAQEVLFIIKNT